MERTVKYCKSQGLKAKRRERFDGTKYLVAQTSGGKWVVIDDDIWRMAEKVGLRRAFEAHTALADILSVRV